jgi:hypothetical protein
MTSAASAQQPLRVRPLLGATHVYDTNLFSSSSRSQSDLITRVSPGVEAWYQPRLLQLHGRYSLDLEHFLRRSALTTADGRQAASADLLFSPSRRLAFSLDASFIKTHDPGELNALGGFTFARASARRLSISPTIRRELDSLTAGTIGYTFAADRITTGGSMRSHGVLVGVDRQVSRRDVVGVDYDVRRLTFDSRAALTTYALRLGWERPLTRRIDAAVHAGAGVAGSMVTPDIVAFVRQRTRPVDLSLTYTRMQTTIVGLHGVVDTESVNAIASLAASRDLEIQIAPGISRMRQEGGGTHAWRLTMSAEQRVRGRLLLRVSYDGTIQHGPSFRHGSGIAVSRHLVQFGLGVRPLDRPMNRGRSSSRAVPQRTSQSGEANAESATD